MVERMRRTNGFLMTELIVALSLLGLIFAGFAVSTHGFGAFNRYQWARQRCVAAAQAQLESLAIHGDPIADRECERLWPGVSLSVRREAGTDQWAGLQWIRVTATAPAGPRSVVVELARYVPLVQQPNEGGAAL